MTKQDSVYVAINVNDTIENFILYFFYTQQKNFH